MVQAIRRLTRTYSLIERSATLGETACCLAAHMIDGRESAQVIDELECLFARATQSRQAGRTR